MSNARLPAPVDKGDAAASLQGIGARQGIGALQGIGASEALIRDPDGGMARLRAIMARLRDPDTGCPWDIAQDFDSIAPYTIEEAHEVADAIARRAWAELPGELGDLLLQVVYHAQMASEAGHFTFDDVVRAISDKMVARHPHVFGTESRDKSAAQQSADWERIKASERAQMARSGATQAAGGPDAPTDATTGATTGASGIAVGTGAVSATAPALTGVLDGVALGLPGLTRAVKLQARAARVGFDWPDTGQVLDKLTEEARELVAARKQLSSDAVEDEMGDLLFVMANLARHLGVDPEAAIRRTNAKFIRRFRYVEAELRSLGRGPLDSDLAEMDALWTLAKQSEAKQAEAQQSEAKQAERAASDQV